MLSCNTTLQSHSYFSYSKSFGKWQTSKWRKWVIPLPRRLFVCSSLTPSVSRFLVSIILYWRSEQLSKTFSCKRQWQWCFCCQLSKIRYHLVESSCFSHCKPSTFFLLPTPSITFFQSSWTCELPWIYLVSWFAWPNSFSHQHEWAKTSCYSLTIPFFTWIHHKIQLQDDLYLYKFIWYFCFSMGVFY